MNVMGGLAFFEIPDGFLDFCELVIWMSNIVTGICTAAAI